MWGILEKALKNRKENTRLPLEHRSLNRLSKILSITCRAAGIREPFMALTEIMDTCGMKCNVPLQLAEGDTIRVEILLSSSLPVLRFNCMVTWCRAKSLKKSFECAMDFIDIASSDRLYLQRYIARYSLEMPRSA